MINDGFSKKNHHIKNKKKRFLTIAKDVVKDDEIPRNINEKLRLNLWKNTSAVTNWFTGIQEKQICICTLCPSTSSIFIRR